MVIHSYNGGGIRGLMVAFIMRMSEAFFGCEIKPNIYAGTSVGSIIVTLRALDYTWIEICNFFTKLGPQIFKKSFFPRIFRSKYSDRNINAILKEYIGAGTMISDIKDCILIIPTVDTSTDTLKVWTNIGNYTVDESGYQMYRQEKGEDAKLWEIVRASCSAPRYFPRFKINGRYFEDGGLKANNPSGIAFTIARTLTWEPIHILSLTTGRKMHSMKESEVNDGIQVAGHVINSTLDAIDENTHFYLRNQIRPNDIYFRIETQVRSSSGEVDDVSKKNVEAMIQDANLTFNANYKELSTFSNNPVL